MGLLNISSITNYLSVHHADLLAKSANRVYIIIHILGTQGEVEPTKLCVLQVFFLVPAFLLLIF
jgi:hypothetical protein